MDNKIIAVAGAVIGLIAVGGIYQWMKSNETETASQPTSNKDSKMHNKTEALDELMLSTAKSMYNDVMVTTQPGAERTEQIKTLLVQLIYSHVNCRDCKDDVNRTYIDWVRKMSLPNPEHYEAIIRRCADEGITTMSGVREVVFNHRSGMAITTKEQHHRSVKSLEAIKCIDDAIAAGVLLPEDVYVIKIDSILDIPVKITLTGQQNVVVLEDIG